MVMFNDEIKEAAPIERFPRDLPPEVLTSAGTAKTFRCSGRKRLWDAVGRGMELLASRTADEMSQPHLIVLTDDFQDQSISHWKASIHGYLREPGHLARDLGKRNGKAFVNFHATCVTIGSNFQHFESLAQIPHIHHVNAKIEECFEVIKRSLLQEGSRAPTPIAPPLHAPRASSRMVVDPPKPQPQPQPQPQRMVLNPPKLQPTMQAARAARPPGQETPQRGLPSWDPFAALAELAEPVREVTFRDPKSTAASGGLMERERNKELCRFYLNGECKFGNKCNRYHPPR